MDIGKARLGERALDDFRKLMADTREARKRARDLIARGCWREVERNEDRAAAYVAKRVPPTPRSAAEAIRGALDFQPASFLTIGARVRTAVAYVESPLNSSVGSGFLVSPNLFITNQHVLESADHAKSAQITFGREIEAGRLTKTTAFRLDPDRFSLFSPESVLDYALVAVGDRIAGEDSLESLGYCILSDHPDKHMLGMSVNIIQHPLGSYKMISVRNNLLQYRTTRSLLYETDTEHGSSGSPVFNDEWELIALHHWGEPSLALGDGDEKANTQVNEGVRISAIYGDLKQRLGSLDGDQRALLAQALTFADAPPPSPHKLGAPRAVSSRESFAHTGVDMSSAGNPVVMPVAREKGGEVKVVVPIEITVRVGAAAPPVLAVAPVAAVPQSSEAEPPKPLLKAAEALKIDRDYASRKGYQEDFIPGHVTPAPRITGPLAEQVAPLRAGEPHASEGVLRYEHFSIVINKAKRIAFFTATNIDGATYLNVDRKTGQVASTAEGDRWFKDPRISNGFVLDQSFYSDWSDYFDRGHLTRRSDPTWGDASSAERANADTFHFTNCSPQHFRFNQSAKFWQGVERYVLENGVLAEDSGKRLCVIQGPIFDEKIDRWADDVQIPSSFFKIVVWKGKLGLKSVGLVVDQLNLLDEPRKNLGSPEELKAVEVQQWRVSVESIEGRTGIDFGEALRKADTINSAGQPQVGAEAIIRVANFADLLPSTERK
ncbi:DNA/RNA non-specific endonuclease [Methylocystis sp. SC2]|uniref:DNA/RNA non-specific endonuclease n=1 Tax=Methylocystis sp. (strain SC2) TaxID=187303 RepID=UPI00027AEA98|nr:DNA/RNA non-specific endonuclease [Methylocystis sp. SC2]CCJ06817.1 DNA/RNA non-specific endonuclease [Methylocystis sp. SC2]